MLPTKLRSPSSSARWSLLLGHLLTPWWPAVVWQPFGVRPLPINFRGCGPIFKPDWQAESVHWFVLPVHVQILVIDFATVFELLLWYCYSTLITDSVGASFNLGMVPIIVAWSPLFLKTKRRAHLLERQQKPYPTFAKVNKCIIWGRLWLAFRCLVTFTNVWQMITSSGCHRFPEVCRQIHGKGRSMRLCSYTTDLCRNGKKHRHGTWKSMIKLWNWCIQHWHHDATRAEFSWDGSETHRQQQNMTSSWLCAVRLVMQRQDLQQNKSLESEPYVTYSNLSRTWLWNVVDVVALLAHVMDDCETQNSVFRSLSDHNSQGVQHPQQDVWGDGILAYPKEWFS